MAKPSPIVKWIALVGPAGLSPVAPGTAGALFALPLGWALRDAPLWGWILTALVVTAIGTWASEMYARAVGGGDPQEVVVDELAGCLIAMVFLPWSWGWALLAFGLFRLFDIWKPGPIRWIDERMKGGVAIMGDDVAAGLVAGLVGAGIRWVGLHFGWWG